MRLAELELKGFNTSANSSNNVPMGTPVIEKNIENVEKKIEIIEKETDPKLNKEPTKPDNPSTIEGI